MTRYEPELRAFREVLRVSGAGLRSEPLMRAGYALDAISWDHKRASEAFDRATTTAQFFERLIVWLDVNGHNVAAAYLSTMPGR